MIITLISAVVTVTECETPPSPKARDCARAPARWRAGDEAADGQRGRGGREEGALQSWRRELLRDAPHPGRRRPLSLPLYLRTQTRARDASSGAPGFPASPAARAPRATPSFIPPTLQAQRGPRGLGEPQGAAGALSPSFGGCNSAGG